MMWNVWWVWIVAGFSLGVLEILAPGYIFLGFAIGALVTGGLLGLGGFSDLRALHAAGTPEAQFALQHFAYWAVRHAGSMVAAMGGLDAVVFTGGIGENDPWMRKEILSGLAYLGVSSDLVANARNETVLHDATSRVVILVVPADEERQIALEAQGLMAGEGA